MSLNFFSQSKKPSWHLWQFPHHLPSTYHQDINFNVKTSSFLLAFPRLLLLSRDPYFIIIRLGSLLISHLPVSPHFSIFTIEIDISQFCDYEIEVWGIEEQKNKRLFFQGLVKQALTFSWLGVLTLLFTTWDEKIECNGAKADIITLVILIFIILNIDSIHCIRIS